MKEVRACFLVLGLLVAVHATAHAKQDSKDQAADAPSETCTVEGTVLSAASGERLKSAMVVLINTQNVFYGAQRAYG
jgi:hypothetical protein